MSCHATLQKKGQRLSLLTCRSLSFSLIIYALPTLSSAGYFSHTHSDGLSPKENLGKQLFFDTNLSTPPGQSCASCHDPNVAFTDPDQNLPTSAGVLPQLKGNRNTPTAMYAVFSPSFHYDTEEELYLGGQFWDGRAATLVEQAKGPFLNPVEMANPNKESVVDKVQQSSYASLFEQVYGNNAFDNTDEAYNYIADAIAAFEGTPVFSPFTSKYDYFLSGKVTLTEQEDNGLRLFNDEHKGNCAACHTSKPSKDGTPPLFTDFSYDNLGVPPNPDNPFYSLPVQFNPAGWNFVDMGLGGALHDPKENGKFKTPTLRNIAVTAPYMHNGYFKTLRGVVDFYSSRDVKRTCRTKRDRESAVIARHCWPVSEVHENKNGLELGNLNLSSQEIDDIVAFLHTLTDGYQLPKQ